MAFGAIIGIISAFRPFRQWGDARNIRFLIFIKYFVNNSFSGGNFAAWHFWIAGVFLAAATGLWLGVAVIRWLVYDAEWIKNKFAQSIRFFIFAIVPMLIPGGFIESFITPRILAFLTACPSKWTLQKNKGGFALQRTNSFLIFALKIKRAARLASTRFASRGR